MGIVLSERRETIKNKEIVKYHLSPTCAREARTAYIMSPVRIKNPLGSQPNLTLTWYVFLCNIFNVNQRLQNGSCCIEIQGKLSSCNSGALKCQVQLHSIDRMHFKAQASTVSGNKQPLCPMSKHQSWPWL